ncbi:MULTISPECIES: hypothetical protein [unclassified Aureimonas]|uniref:hypothetical protein n=1 Tax=unclassified Aureimonas TaxID=2615206 RepID=UPI0006F6D2ED|nr:MULTISPECIES: hypothetical protein [unclassified Aureimonas]KQT64016.1 hypothetical protein ASG62_03080 [Aureimonas sp. Leaf427]KQT81209.1 hypothetical protein ASG54_00350 [Aureimonas sp. Leaf460]
MDQPSERPPRDLSPGDIRCLQALAAGGSETTPSLDLGLEPDLGEQAIDLYLASLYRKLGTRSRTHAVAIALYEGIIRLGTA